MLAIASSCPYSSAGLAWRLRKQEAIPARSRSNESKLLRAGIMPGRADAIPLTADVIGGAMSGAGLTRTQVRFWDISSVLAAPPFAERTDPTRAASAGFWLPVQFRPAFDPCNHLGRQPCHAAGADAPTWR